MRSELGDPKFASVSVFKRSSPDDLVAYSNNVLICEAEIWGPLWISSLKGACGVSDSPESKLKVNIFRALSTAVSAKRSQGPFLMSALSTA